jgi:hypothetical protein
MMSSGACICADLEGYGAAECGKAVKESLPVPLGGGDDAVDLLRPGVQLALDGGALGRAQCVGSCLLSLGAHLHQDVAYLLQAGLSHGEHVLGVAYVVERDLQALAAGVHLGGNGEPGRVLLGAVDAPAGGQPRLVRAQEAVGLAERVQCVQSADVGSDTCEISLCHLSISLLGFPGGVSLPRPCPPGASRKGG